MEIYFLKSAACLAALLLFYKLLLEKEDMHVFNRFYLLSAVIISFVVPFISFTTYVEVPAETFSTPVTFSSTLATPPSPEPVVPLWPKLLWSLYGLGFLIFTIKFGMNLKKLFQKIRHNLKLKDGAYTKVLLKEDIVPHTFLDYIFLNKKKFEEHSIPKEVFEHEQAHAAQKHSYDILFMELLQVVFWFHPLLYFTKNAIKLNHEFLADKMVLKKGTATAEYQQMLLAFSSGASLGSLAHPINYSFIKKRFTVMKIQTSRQSIWARSLLVLPLAALLLYGFSTKEVIERTGEASTLASNSEIFELLVDDSGNIFFGKAKTSLENIQDLVEANNYSSFRISLTENTSEVLVGKILTIMFNKELEGSVSSCSTTTQELPGTATAEMIKWYDEVAKQINSLPDPKIKSEDVSKLLRIYHWMSPEQKKVAEPFPKTPIERVYSNIKIQEIATPEMIAEYNKLAKYYNSLPEDHSVIRMEDIRRMRYIHSLMTEEQKKKAEPLPAIYPPPPPPPPAPPVDGVHPEVPEPPVPPTPKPWELEVPGPPPPPPAPVEHIKELAGKGARFFLSGKGEISAKEAIKLVEDQKNLSIRVTDYNSETTVHISEEIR